jgi:hypothetical protein
LDSKRFTLVSVMGVLLLELASGSLRQSVQTQRKQPPPDLSGLIRGASKDLVSLYVLNDNTTELTESLLQQEQEKFEAWHRESNSKRRFVTKEFGGKLELIQVPGIQDFFVLIPNLDSISRAYAADARLMRDVFLPLARDKALGGSGVSTIKDLHLSDENAKRLNQIAMVELAPDTPIRASIEQTFRTESQGKERYDLVQLVGDSQMDDDAFKGRAPAKLLKRYSPSQLQEIGKEIGPLSVLSDLDRTLSLSFTPLKRGKSYGFEVFKRIRDHALQIYDQKFALAMKPLSDVASEFEKQLPQSKLRQIEANRKKGMQVNLVSTDFGIEFAQAIPNAPPITTAVQFSIKSASR